MSRSLYRIVNNTVVKTIVQSSTYWHDQIVNVYFACVQVRPCVCACVCASSGFNSEWWHFSIYIEILSHKSEQKLKQCCHNSCLSVYTSCTECPCYDLLAPSLYV